MSHATRGPASAASGDRRQGEFAPATDTQWVRRRTTGTEVAR